MDEFYIALKEVRKAYAGTRMADHIYHVTRNFHRDFWGERLIGAGESMMKIYRLTGKEIDVTETIAFNEIKRVVAQYA